MPLFEYTCKSCNKSREELQSKPQDALECPCGGSMVRQMSTCNHKYIGTGFYANREKEQNARDMGFLEGN